MLDFKPDEWVSVINDPRESNLYNKYYMAKYLGNVKDSHVGWINVEMDRMNELTKNSIELHKPDILIQIPSKTCGIFDFQKTKELIELGKKKAINKIKNFEKKKPHHS